MQNTISLKLTDDEYKGVEKALVSLYWFESPLENEYVSLRMKNDMGSVATVYTSKKIVFQGEESFEKEIERIKGGEKKEDTKVHDHIGVDEVGKGDYFGPLVVVACFVDDEFSKKVTDLGFGDSKNFSDKKILQFFEEVKEYPYYYASIVMPEEYNTLVDQIGNTSILLAKQHSKVIEMGLEDLKKKNIQCTHVVIDQFSSLKSRVVNELGELGKKIELEQYHKGESDIAVASASILARGIFLNEMENMRRKYSFDFPKGASNVINPAKEFVKKYGEGELRRVAKIGFKTTRKVISLV
jgi:ribonuclease HIII